MSDFPSRFEFEEFKQLALSQIAAARAIASRTPARPIVRVQEAIQGIQGEMGPKGLRGDKGDPGSNGLKGDQGAAGQRGLKGDQGEPGPKGDIGPMPRHRWDGTALQFEQGPDGNEWGNKVDLQGPAGAGGTVMGGGGGTVVIEKFGYMPSGW